MHHPYKYVDGISGDYVFPAKYKDGDSLNDYIEDYGGISNETIVELLFQFSECNEDLSLIFAQMALRLSKNLNIKLRKKPLTDKEWFEEDERINKKYEEDFD
jgi:5'-3' exonuclease